MVDLDPDRVPVQTTVPDTTDKVQVIEKFESDRATLQDVNEKIRVLEEVEKGRRFKNCYVCREMFPDSYGCDRCFKTLVWNWLTDKVC